MLIRVMLLFRSLQKTISLKLNSEWDLSHELWNIRMCQWLLFTMHINYEKWLDVRVLLHQKTTLVPNNKLWYVPYLACLISEHHYCYCCLPIQIFLYVHSTQWLQLLYLLVDFPISDAIASEIGKSTALVSSSWCSNLWCNCIRDWNINWKILKLKSLS